MGEPLLKDREIERTIEKIPQKSFSVLDFIDAFRASSPADGERLVKRFGLWGEKRRYTVTTYLANRLDQHSQRPDSRLRLLVHWSEGGFADRRRTTKAERTRFGSPWIAAFRKTRRHGAHKSLNDAAIHEITMLSLDRKPDWLRVRPPAGENYAKLKGLLRELNLHTVCEEAHCPNVAECWGGGTATIMLLGDTCTRACRFCAVTSGNPHGVVDPLEPIKVATAIAELGLSYVVLTSVDRDDLPDGGAAHFAQTVRSIKALDSGILVETLVPDFQGDTDAIRTVARSGQEVFDHNVETVRRLQAIARDRRANYEQSLFVLQYAKDVRPELSTKSSIMLGLGETDDEVVETLHDLREVDVDIVTLGQYLRPSSWHLAVSEYVPPETFERYRAEAQAMGFRYAAAGPLVRSSYRAGEFFLESMLRREGAIADG